MRFRTVLLVVITLLIAPAAFSAILIRNVHVVTMEPGGAVIANGSVLVEDGRIARIFEPGAKPPETAAQIIDGNGGWLIPGLIDCHIHYDQDRELPGYLRHGVTTVLSLGRTEEAMKPLPAISAKIAAGTFPGPRVYATGPILSNHVKIESAADAREFVRKQAANGYGFVKLYNATSQEVFDATVAEARRLKLGVFGHMPRALAPGYVVKHGINVIAHMEELFFTAAGGPPDRDLDALTPDWTPNLERTFALLDAIQSNDVAIIPNLVASHTFMNLWADPETLFASPEMAFVDRETAAAWRQGHYATRANIEKRMLRERLKLPVLYALTWQAHKKGVLLVAGTDSPLPAIFPGKALHTELRLLVAAGLTPTEALATATRNAGKLVQSFVDPPACIGVIRAGCEADLVLLAKNPAIDIRNTEAIVGIMADGRWSTPESLTAARH
ncbi:MAG TPA: amidohydrolase family protein [Thermoanaerobaculia bacterium]|nr:amidohydrolase family protein [Thermoanaerobaculia bacterium]